MIDESVLNARIPRLGTITVGRGVEATSKRGASYSRPTRAKTFVFHTDDEEVADAVQATLGGEVVTDSPTWDYDVVTEARSFEALLLGPGWRQHLELWRAAECLRRCDGIRMVTKDGRPINEEPCACQPEIDRGYERACRPTTIMPVILDLDVERLGIWEVRSNSWGTASALAGTMRALGFAGAAGASVPTIVSMVDRTVRDSDGTPREVTEIHAAIAQSQRSLAALASSAAALDAPGMPTLPSGGEEADRLALMEEWGGLQGQAHSLGLRQTLVEDWRQMFGSGRRFEDLDVAELRGWVEVVRGTVQDAERAIEEERAEAAQHARERHGPASATTPPDQSAPPHSGDEGPVSGDDPVGAPPIPPPPVDG